MRTGALQRSPGAKTHHLLPKFSRKFPEPRSLALPLPPLPKIPEKNSKRPGAENGQRGSGSGSLCHGPPEPVWGGRRRRRPPVLPPRGCPRPPAPGPPGRPALSLPRSAAAATRVRSFSSRAPGRSEKEKFSYTCGAT